MKMFCVQGKSTRINKLTQTMKYIVIGLVYGQSPYEEKLCEVFEMDKKKNNAVLISGRSTCRIFLLCMCMCVRLHFLSYLLLISRNRRCMSPTLFTSITCILLYFVSALSQNKCFIDSI